MPDFGLTEALAAAMKGAKSAEVLRPAEQRLAAQAAKTAPAAAAPAVPEPAAAPPGPAAPVAVRSADPPPGAVQAPPVDPSVPPPDIPPPAASDAAALPSAQPSSPDAAGAGGDAAPPQGALAAAEPVPQAKQPPAAPGEVPAASKLPPEATPEPQVPTDTQVAAKQFVTANIGDFSEEKLNMDHMPNVDVMTSPDGMRAAILQVADDNKEAITAARRGTITDQQLTGLAQDLSTSRSTIEQVLGREPGTNFVRPEVALAARMIEQNQMGSLLSLADKVANNSASSAEIAQFEQHSQVVEQYITMMQAGKAEWGRTGRALSIPVGLPDEVRDHIADVLRQNNPDMAATAAAIRLAGTPAGIANIVSGVGKVSALRGTAMYSTGLLQRIFINGILSGPPTWAKIFLGNNLNLALNTFDLYAAGIGRGMYGLAARLGAFPTAAEGVQISDAVAHMHGVISGGADALRVAGRVVKTGQSLDSIMSAGRAAEGAPKGAQPLQNIFPNIQGTYFGGIMHVIDSVIDAPGARVISPIDEATKTLGFRGYATMMTLKEIRAKIAAGTLAAGDAEAVAKQMMENPDPAMQQASEDWAHRMTFQAPFPEAGVGQAFSNVLNKAPVLRFIFPFMRTATNIFKQSIVERTPLAVFSSRLRAQIAAGGFEGDLAKARIATGTAIGSMLGWMAIHDRITGDAPKDAKERAAWELDGRTPYSIRVTDPITGKDTWRSYAWFEPIATVAGAVSDSVSLMSYIHSDDDTFSMMPHEDRTNEAIEHIMASIIQNTGNKTFMQGAAQFSEMYNDPQRAFGMWADQMGANMQPFSGATKFVRNMQDPFMRQAYTLMDKVRDQLPTGMGVAGSKTLPMRLDVFGNPRTRSGDNNILGPLNPLPGSSAKKDPVTDEIQNLMEQTRTVPITMPSKRLALLGSGKGMQAGSGMQLNPTEYADYVQMSRADPIFDGGTKTFHQKLEETIGSTVYQKATPPERKEMITAVQNSADKIGAQRMFKESPDFAERMTDWTSQANRLKFNR